MDVCELVGGPQDGARYAIEPLWTDVCIAVYPQVQTACSFGANDEFPRLPPITRMEYRIREDRKFADYKGIF